MVSGQVDQNPSGERIFGTIMLYVIGLVFMIAADIQKYVRLQYK